MADKTGYIGRSPSDSTTIIARQSFSVGISTDSFSFNSGYTPGYVDVYINGVKLIDVSDFSATDGSNITLLTAANNGDVVEVVAYKAFNIGSISDTPGNFNVGNVLTAQSGSVSGNFTVGGVLTYEDVTNVDSIGVITARTGVDVLAGGVDITGGGLKVVGVTSLTGNTVVSNNADVTISSGSSVTTAEHFYFNDGKKANFGNDSDLQIYHNDTSGYIDNNKGALYIRNNVDDDDGGNIIIQSKSGESAAVFQDDEGVRLYYDGSEKFATTGGGVDVTGITTSDGFYATSVGVGTALFVEGDARVTGILTVGTASISIDGNVSYPTIRPILDLNFAASKTLDRRITFTRDSFGTYTDDLGTVKHASNNVPRFDHNPTTGESLGLLIEESRTNLITYSVIQTAYWNNSASTVTDNTDETTAPDGTNTAFKYVPDNGGTGWVSVYNTSNQISMTNGTSYTCSVWAKPSHSDFTGFRLLGDVRDGGGINISANFVLSGDGSVSGTYDSAKITKYPNGWYRCEATGTADSTTTEEPGFQTSANGDGTKGFYVWGYQVEEGAFATSYIPTSGTTVTRGADTVVAKGTNFTDFYNASESTIFFESKVPPTNNSKFFTFHGNDGGGVEMIESASVSGPGASIFTYANGTTYANISVTDSSATTLKYAAGIKANDINLALNGTLGTADTSSTQPDAIDELVIGNYISGNYYLNTTIKRLSYYNKRLPDAQMKALTLS